MDQQQRENRPMRVPHRSTYLYGPLSFTTSWAKNISNFRGREIGMAGKADNPGAVRIPSQVCPGCFARCWRKAEKSAVGRWKESCRNIPGLRTQDGSFEAAVQQHKVA